MNHDNEIPKKVSLAVMLVFIIGCSVTTYNNLCGMTPTDGEFLREGWTIRCTETIGNECITHQWFNENGTP